VKGQAFVVRRKKLLEMGVFNALNGENHAFCVYITWGGFLIIKMLLMSLFTGLQRSRKGVTENPEDARINQKLEIKKDEDVERVRRAHLNDLENIPAFLFAALM
jgi:glutathione S-transferase